MLLNLAFKWVFRAARANLGRGFADESAIMHRRRRRPPEVVILGRPLSRYYLQRVTGTGAFSRAAN